MGIGVHVRGELPEPIRMMDGAYRRGVAMQKLKMLLPLMPYMSAQDRAELLNSPAMQSVFQDAGIGQVPQFEPTLMSPLDQAKTKYYEGMTGYYNAKTAAASPDRPMSPMEAAKYRKMVLETQALWKKIHSKDYETKLRDGMVYYYNKHDPKDFGVVPIYHTDPYGGIRLFGTDMVIKEPTAQVLNQGGVTVEKIGKKVTPVITTASDTSGNKTVSVGGKVYQTSSVSEDTQMQRDIQAMQGLVDLLRAQEIPPDKIAEALQAGYGPRAQTFIDKRLIRSDRKATIPRFRSQAAEARRLATVAKKTPPGPPVEPLLSALSDYGRYYHQPDLTGVVMNPGKANPQIDFADAWAKARRRLMNRQSPQTSWGLQDIRRR